MYNLIMLNHKWKIISIVIITAIAAGAYFYYSRETPPAYKFEIVKISDLSQEVSVTGRVKSAQSVDLAFEKTGKVIEAAVNIGDKVGSGQVLLKLSNAELTAQLAQGEAELESAKAQLGQYNAALESQIAKLNELNRGSRMEEIEISETKVQNAKKILADAETNLGNILTKAEVDLDEDYNSALDAAAKAVTVGTNSVFVVTDMQSAHFSGSDQQSIDVADAKAEAVFALFGGQNAGRSSKDAISKLNGGAKGAVEKARVEPTQANIDKAAADVASAIQKTKQMLEAVPVISTLTSAETTNLNTEKLNVNMEIINISGKQQAILVQKSANQSAVSSAEAQVNSAKNSLATASVELALLKAGSSQEQIAAQEAQVKQAEANILVQKAKIKQAEANMQNIQAQLAKTILHSPINGVITRQDAKIGEIASAGVSMISIISDKQFEIESNIPEADIVKIKIGNEAKLTLDAYGDDLVFTARIISINPAETFMEGVPTYKTTLQFIEEDGRIKSGMTANMDILTEQREKVIAIPQRAVFTKEGKKLVRVLDNSGGISERDVKTGIRGSSGRVEILEGLAEGEKVVTFMENVSY